MKETKYNLINESIYKTTFANNMQLFVMPKKGFTKTYSVFATNYGSNDLEFVNPHTKEQLKVNPGIAHFLEHKMFEMPDGTNAFDQFSKYGASANAYTNFDTTAYLFSTSSNLEDALKHLITYVQTPYFTDENVEKEKGIIAQEIKMYDDNPQWQVFFNTLKAMYKTHPNSIDIAGTVDSINKITKEELYNCYNTFYSPSNMALFVIGDVDPEKIEKIVRETTTDKNMFQGQIKRIPNQETDEIRQKEIKTKLEVSIPMWSMGYKETKHSLENTKDKLKKEIIMEIITDMLFSPGSDLHKNLFDSSLIYSPLSAGYTGGCDYGYYTIENESKDPEKVVKIIQDEIEKYKNKPLDKKHFETVKKVKLGTFIRGFDSIEAIANVYLSYHFKGIDMLKYYETLQSITIEEVQETIKDFFNQEMQVLSIVEPK